MAGRVRRPCQTEILATEIAAAAQRNFRVLLCHGLRDASVLPEAAEASRDALVAGGLEVELRTFDSGHSLGRDQIETIGLWLQLHWAHPIGQLRRRDESPKRPPRLGYQPYSSVRFDSRRRPMPVQDRLAARMETRSPASGSAGFSAPLPSDLLLESCRRVRVASLVVGVCGPSCSS